MPRAAVVAGVVIFGLTGLVADRVVARGSSAPGITRGVVAGLSSASSQATDGQFVSTGSLNNARDFHEATLLSDGAILLTGGNSSGPTATAEIFDSTGTASTPTGSLVRARWQHSATLLDDGRVLIAGGYNGNTGGTLANAEIYDPGTGSSSSIASLHRVRTEHTATRLLDGRVLLAGGDTNSGPISGAEVFDPLTETFMVVGNMMTVRGYHTATLLNDGRVLVVGGSHGGGDLASAEIFNPASGTFTPVGSLNVGRFFHSATLLQDGTVLIVGGYGNGAIAVPSAEIFNPSTGTFSGAGSLHTARARHGAALLPSGEVLFTGGAHHALGVLATAEIFSPASNTFTVTAGSLIASRVDHTATALTDGRVLLAGGSTGFGPTSSAEIFEPLEPLDETPPSVHCSSPDGLWHALDVSLACTASDDGSGLQDAADASFLLTTNVPAGSEDADAATNSRTVCDNANNCATAGPVSGNMIDKRGPAVSIAAPTANYALNQVVIADFSCPDGGSGATSCAGPVADGAAINTSTVGSHTFSVTATDAAGNTTIETRTYTVSYNLCVLFDLSRAYKANSTIPIKLQLCDAAGVNVSNASVAIHAISVHLVSNSASGELADSGNANPDSQFRFSDGSYIFNLSLKGYSEGTYALAFMAGADVTSHTLQFKVR